MSRLPVHTVLLLLVILVAACGPPFPEPLPRPTPMLTPENLYAPKPGDERLTRGSAFIDSADLLVMESYPPQIMLLLRGNLPTPCDELRVRVHSPDEQNRIQVDVYSVSDPNKICIQVLAAFKANIPLGSFAPRHYTVWVNGKQVGEFDA